MLFEKNNGEMNYDPFLYIMWGNGFFIYILQQEVTLFGHAA